MPTRAARGQSSDIQTNLDAFMVSLEAGNKAPSTRVSYAEAVRALDAFLERTGMPRVVAYLRREHVEAFLVSLTAKGQRPTTVANRFRSLQQFFHFLKDEGEISESPMRNMRPPIVPEQPVVFPRADALTKLLATCSGQDFESRRDLAIIWLLVDTGVRRSECANLKVEDVDVPTGRVARVLGKGRKYRDVPFHANATQALLRYKRARSKFLSEKGLDPEFPWLWVGRRGRFDVTGISQMLGRHGDEAGLGHIHPHLLRHAWADRMLRNGMQEGEVMRLAGWTTRQMLQRYGAHAEAERAIEAYRRLPDEL